MADLTIASDDGGMPVIITDGTTTNAVTTTLDPSTNNVNLNVIRPDAETTGTLAAVNAAVTVLHDDIGSMVFVVSGTWVGTIVAEGSSDDGTTWTLLSIALVPGGLLSTAGITSNGQYRVAVLAGYNQTRLRMSAYTSGSASAVLNLSNGVAYPLCFQPNAANLNVTATLGNSSGKSVVMQTGTLVTTATTANQVILTYTVTAGKTFYLQYYGLSAKFTVFTNNTDAGTASLESPAGTKLVTDQFLSTHYSMIPLQFDEPIPFAAGTVVRAVCTPAATTSMTWIANFGGYEK